jgi:PAS domain S-box-containing protein
MSSHSPAQYEAMLETIAEKAKLALLRADLSDAFNRRGELDEVLQACTEAVVHHLDAAFARIWVLDKAGETLELRASAGLYTHLDGPHGRVKLGEFKIGRIARNLQPHVSNSVTTDLEVGNPDWARREGMISFAGYPLTLEDKALGVVAFFAKHELSLGVINELEPIADGIAQWIKRKQAETALAQQQEWFNVTLRSIGDAVLATDIEGKVTFLNPVGEELTGWRLSEALGKPSTAIFNIIDPKNRQPVESPVTKAFREKRTVGLANQTILVAKDGTERAIDDSGAPIRGADGEISGVVLVFRDARERHAAELASERLAAIVHSSDDAIVGKNLSGIITNWNEGAKRIFGYSAEEIIGKSILTLVPAELNHEEKSILAQLQRGQRVEHFETVRLTKDGRRVQVSVTVSPIRDSDGAVIGASKIARDITERKRVEQALIDAQNQLQLHATDLEQRVEDRTKSLRKTVAELEAFSYSLSHDMRAPLRAVQSYLQIFVEDYGAKVDDAGLKVLNKVIASAQRMDRMVLDLLTFTRLSHEEMSIERVDVESLVREIITERPDLEGSPYDIVVKSPLSQVMGNEGSLSQCLTNLVDNAIKFVAPGVSPHVQIGSENAGQMVRIWVEDNGIGINTEEKGKLFGMFQRLHGNDYPGTGIGLAIVRKAVERMGGTSGVESEPGKGSRFWLDLPGVEK